MPNKNSTAFDETLDYLYSRLPVFQLQGKEAINYKLDKTLQFLAYLNNPQERLKFIHVGGTNGKGSVSHMLASVFQEADYAVGLYTSPHLKSFTERIKINGIEIDEPFVVDWVQQHKPFIEELKPSFFEATVAMAFDFFAQKGVDIVVLEVGMGGRLDSTNVVNPELSIITNISYDHAQYLGDTLEKIASEKAGIIKSKTPVVIGETQEEIKHVFLKKAQEVSAPIKFADSTGIDTLFTTDLKGSYQVKNIRTALVALEELGKLGWAVEKNELKNGLEHVVRNTGLKGRWQQLNDSPKTICDTGHNEAGFTFILDQLSKERGGDIYFILGFVKEKEVEKVMTMLPKDGIYYFCGGNNQRLAKPSDLVELALKYQLDATEVADVNEGLRKATNRANKSTDTIFVGGSTFIVAEIEGL